MKKILTAVALCLLTSCGWVIDSHNDDALIILPGKNFEYECNMVQNVHIKSTQLDCKGTLYFCRVRNNQVLGTFEIIGHTIAARCNDSDNLYYNLSDVTFGNYGFDKEILRK